MILSFESVIRSGYWLSHHLDDRLTNRLKQRDPVLIKLNAFLGFCQEKFVAPLGSGIMWNLKVPFLTGGEEELGRRRSRVSDEKCRKVETSKGQSGKSVELKATPKRRKKNAENTTTTHQGKAIVSKQRRNGIVDNQHLVTVVGEFFFNSVLVGKFFMLILTLKVSSIKQFSPSGGTFSQHSKVCWLNIWVGLKQYNKK